MQCFSWDDTWPWLITKWMEYEYNRMCTIGLNILMCHPNKDCYRSSAWKWAQAHFEVNNYNGLIIFKLDCWWLFSLLCGHDVDTPTKKWCENLEPHVRLCLVPQTWQTVNHGLSVFQSDRQHIDGPDAAMWRCETQGYDCHMLSPIAAHELILKVQLLPFSLQVSLYI